MREVHKPVPGNLDLNVAEDDEYSPDKLRASMERFYMTVILGLMSFGNHIARLRSWREYRRTTAFCAAYFVAWIFDYLVLLFSLTLITLIFYPKSRDIMFPPAPIALIDTKTGGVQKPKAGVLGSTDSATGAPENFKGEAAEAEASNFVSTITSVALASASGKQPPSSTPQNSQDEDSPNTTVPDPTSMAVGASMARSSASSSSISPKQDKTKVPVSNAVWSKMRPTMHAIADINDTWERFGNALSPTPPFPKDVFHLRIAALVVPVAAASVFVSSYMFMKGLTFGIGAGFFSDPLIWRGLEWLNKNYPNWQKLLEIRNTLLKGVPTNAQLALTLLRIGEANSAPLPPPPTANEPPPDGAVEVADDHVEALGATDEEVKAAAAHDPSVAHQVDGDDVAAAKEKSHGKKGARFLAMVKGSVRGSIETTLGADHLKAKAGSETSKQRLGVIPRSKEQYLSGPVDFKCRYKGKRGHAYISTRATTPCVSFSLDKSIGEKSTVGRGDGELQPIWSVAVSEIRELRKVGGLGWKAKLVVGWALEREVADGLEIFDKQGNHYVVTAMVLRDELFNRLVAMGGQKWEQC